MLLKWISLTISQLIDLVYRSIQEEDRQWDDVVNKLDEEVLLSIERYNQMEKRFNDATFFMQCTINRKITDRQKRDFKHASIMCSMTQCQNEKSTQTINDRTVIIENESQLIDDVICKFIKVESENLFKLFSFV
jgi:hypothetical protein